MTYPDNLIHLPARGSLLPDGITPEAYDQLLALVDDDHEIADEIIAAGWRPTGTGGAA